MKRVAYFIVTLLLLALLVPEGSWAQGKSKAAEKKSDHTQHAQKQQGGNVQKQRANKGQERKVTAAPRKQETRQAVTTKKADSEAASGRERARAVEDSRSVKRADLKHEMRGATGSASVRKLVSSRRALERVAGAALVRAYTRGTDDEAFAVTPVGERVRITNRAGRVLLDMDDDRARNLGYWDVHPMRDDVRSGAPSFCRSGAGHPRWGRQWCIEKGFGLGRYRDVRWGRATTIGDIIFGRSLSTGNLATDLVLGTIGALAFDRLALHAVTLGYTEPLSGVWVAEPQGPRVLQLYSGAYPVAEIVDDDRDDRADVMIVALF